MRTHSHFPSMRLASETPAYPQRSGMSVPGKRRCLLFWFLVFVCLFFRHDTPNMDPRTNPSSSRCAQTRVCVCVCVSFAFQSWEIKFCCGGPDVLHGAVKPDPPFTSSTSHSSSPLSSLVLQTRPELCIKTHVETIQSMP